MKQLTLLLLLLFNSMLIAQEIKLNYNYIDTDDYKHPIYGTFYDSTITFNYNNTEYIKIKINDTSRLFKIVDNGKIFYHNNNEVIKYDLLGNINQSSQFQIFSDATKGSILVTSDGALIFKNK